MKVWVNFHPRGLAKVKALCSSQQRHVYVLNDRKFRKLLALLHLASFLTGAERPRGEKEWSRGDHCIKTACPTTSSSRGDMSNPSLTTTHDTCRQGPHRYEIWYNSWSCYKANWTSCGSKVLVWHVSAMAGVDIIAHSYGHIRVHSSIAFATKLLKTCDNMHGSVRFWCLPDGYTGPLNSFSISQFSLSCGDHTQFSGLKLKTSTCSSSDFFSTDCLEPSKQIKLIWKPPIWGNFSKGQHN